MIVKTLKVNGLWEKYSVDMIFNDDVNILTGINGAGKTTLLEIIHLLLSPNPTDHIVRKKFDTAHLTMINGYTSEIYYNSDGRMECRYTDNGKEINYDAFAKDIRTQSVSNFDSSMPNEELVRRLKEQNPNILSELDVELNRWLEIFAKYMTLVSRRVDSILKEKGNNINKINAIYEPPRRMERICNELFGNKVWHISEKEGSITFLLPGDNNRQILPEQLSSGEKQMLILLISTFVQGEQAGVVFWDEPELSLHIAWQQQLIRVMRMLNPNMQLMIATHSPNILFEGWEQRVLNVQNILKDDTVQ